MPIYRAVGSLVLLVGITTAGERRAAAGTTTTSAASTTAAATAPSTRPVLDPAVAALIDQLGSDDYHKRTTARSGLVARGEPVRAQITRLAGNGESPELRAAAAEILAQLDEAEANRPTQVTLHLKNATPREVMTEVRRQTHLPLPIWPTDLWTARAGDVPRVTVDLDAQPFWAAMGAVCDRMGGTIQVMGNSPNLTVVESDPPLLKGPTSSDGLFTLELQSATSTATVAYDAPAQDAKSATMVFQLYVDPKLTVAQVDRLQWAEAVDNKGRTLKLPEDADVADVDRTPGWLHLVTASLPKASDGATRFSRLKATLTVLVQTRSDTLQVNDLQKDVHTPHNVGTYVVAFEDAKINRRRLTYTMKVTGDSDSMSDLDAALNNVRLTDAAGHVLNRTTTSSKGSDEEMTLHQTAMCSQAIKPPVRLTFVVATELKPRVLRFVFTDLRLPTP